MVQPIEYTITTTGAVPALQDDADHVPFGGFDALDAPRVDGFDLDNVADLYGSPECWIVEVSR